MPALTAQMDSWTVDLMDSLNPMILHRKADGHPSALKHCILLQTERYMSIEDQDCDVNLSAYQIEYDGRHSVTDCWSKSD